ncbi:hypothetical protein [Methylobacillus glycogenes]|uniref:hypothetical protein n=1 Tax=Methylobacillus glycogenes TaxID=406 RepID=UPI0004720978|nr:hypothetical protein [Methylobacillus glycogenes]
MHKIIVILIGLILGLPGVVTMQQAAAEPVQMEKPAPGKKSAPVNNVVPPCDSSAKTSKPDCNTDADSLKQPPAMPGERDSVIVPPEVPAEGLPHQQNEKMPDIDQRQTPQRH